MALAAIVNQVAEPSASLSSDTLELTPVPADSSLAAFSATAEPTDSEGRSTQPTPRRGEEGGRPPVASESPSPRSPIDEEDGDFVVLHGADLPSERWRPVDHIATEDRPCAALRRHDFGPGLASCADCGKSPILNRGCQRCTVRLCSACFLRHKRRGRNLTRTDFEVIKKLGAGATAEVVLARDRLKGRFYALKVMKKTPQRRGRRERSVQRERDVMASVPAQSHFLLRMHAAFQSTSRMFLVVDYMPGGDLYEYIRRKRRLEEAAAKRCMAQVLEGLRTLHAAGYVHRDIKPENVLLDGDGNCKIADFGLAKEHDSCKTFVGTDLYLAPELLGSAAVSRSPQSEASDLWAYGCLIVNVLTGGDPFPGDTPTVVYGAILRAPPRLYSAERSAAAPLIRKLLEKRPADRITSADARAHPWFSDIDWARLHEGVMPGWERPAGPSGKGRPLTESHADPLWDDDHLLRDFSVTLGDLA